MKTRVDIRILERKNSHFEWKCGHTYANVFVDRLKAEMISWPREFIGEINCSS